MVISKTNFKIACSSKCLECFGVNESECLSCNFPLLLNSTTCISTLECSNFGYKNNTFCLRNFLFLLFSFPFFFIPFS